MTTVTQSGATTSKHLPSPTPKVKPSQRLDLGPLELDQTLELFCHWKSKSIWVPPKDTSTDLAKSMLSQFGASASKEECWKGVERTHRSEFTQVREIELPKSSIRLPQGRLFVTVTRQKDFDRIEEAIPNCVQTRLDEFMAGPGRDEGVRVYYLKQLCVEVGNKLVFTTKAEIDAAITLIQEIERYQRKMEFERKMMTMEAVGKWEEFRTEQCTYDELLALTHTPTKERCIEQLCEQENWSEMDRKMFLMATAVTLPWFAALSLAVVEAAIAIATGTTTVAVCDPVFVAEMPGKRGQLLKIGHFDEVDGVLHVEI